MIFSTLDNNQYEEIIQEISERQKRKSNVVVYGIVEQGTATAELQTRAAQDKEQVLILRAVSAPEDRNLKATRIGRYNSAIGSLRPIKISLRDECLVHEIIRKARNLRNMPEFRDVRICFDQIPRHIAYYRLVKQKLDEHLTSGETNLRIKYGVVPR
uniref:Uncharacterized protein n=1 Tax=Anoplophora glabripennis TaxID=217634 RepID=V5GH13_ANOGL